MHANEPVIVDLALKRELLAGLRAQAVQRHARARGYVREDLATVVDVLAGIDEDLLRAANGHWTVRALGLG